MLLKAARQRRDRGSMAVLAVTALYVMIFVWVSWSYLRRRDPLHTVASVHQQYTDRIAHVVLALRSAKPSPPRARKRARLPHGFIALSGKRLGKGRQTK